MESTWNPIDSTGEVVDLRHRVQLLADDDSWLEVGFATSVTSRRVKVWVPNPALAPRRPRWNLRIGLDPDPIELHEMGREEAEGGGQFVTLCPQAVPYETAALDWNDILAAAEKARDRQD